MAIKKNTVLKIASIVVALYILSKILGIGLNIEYKRNRGPDLTTISGAPRRPAKKNYMGGSNSALSFFPDATIKLDKNARKFFGSVQVDDIDDIKNFLMKVIRGRVKQIPKGSEFIGVSMKTKKKGTIFYLKKEFVGKQPTPKDEKQLKKGLMITDPAKDKVGLYIIPTQITKNWVYAGSKEARLLMFNLVILSAPGKRKYVQQPGALDPEEDVIDVQQTPESDNTGAIDVQNAAAWDAVNSWF